MTTFIHTADWHLGKPFHGIEDDQKRALVQQERLAAIRRIGELVRERQAAFVVVAGDNFDSPQATNATISAALGAIGSLEVPVYMIPGNHDHAGPGTLWSSDFFVREAAALAPNLVLLLTSEPVLRDDAVILPCPLQRKFEAEDPTAWIRGLDMAGCGDRPRIVLAHGGTVSFDQPHDEEEPSSPTRHIDLELLATDSIDYIALGDYHGLMQAGTKAWYSGSHEIDRFPKAGQQPGHVACVTVSRGASPRVEPVLTGGFRWIVHEITLGEDTSRFDDELAAMAPVAACDRVLVSLVLRGSVSLAARAEVDRMIETWTARLCRLKLDDQLTIAPTDAEIDMLAAQGDDPIIAGVAASLRDQLGNAGDDGTAAEALRILYQLCQAEGARA
jgi:DNA repair exonuclease SbcCD nuclease subunit